MQSFYHVYPNMGSVTMKHRNLIHILIICVAAAGILAVILLTRANVIPVGLKKPALSADGALVSVYIGNDLYEIAPFNEAATITVDQGNGRINEITLTGEAVFMSHSTCKNRDCVKQGEITIDNYNSRMLMYWIICLPNQVTIEFKPEG